MTVYIDVLFIVNLVVDYFILLSVKCLLKTNDKRIRLLIGAVIGSIYSCLMFFEQLQILSTMLLELLLSMLIVLISFKTKNLLSYFKMFVSFYIISALFGGTVFAIQQFLAPPILTVKNGIPYIDISPLLLIIVSAISYLLIELFSRFLSKRNVIDNIIEIEVGIKDKKVKLSALVDTGNELTDSFSGVPVVICEYRSVKELIPIEIRDLFSKSDLSLSEAVKFTEFKNRFRMIPFSSVSDIQGLLPAFKPDYIKIFNQNEIKKEVIVAVTSKKLSSENKYSSIVSPELLNSIQSKTDSTKIKTSK